MISKTEEIGNAVDKAVFPNLQGGPLMHIIAAKAVAFAQALTEEFRDNMRQVVENAQVLAGVLTQGGVDLVTGGTDNHLMLVDLSATPLTGQDAEDRLDKAGITVNKNAVPFDQRPPMVTSGIRIGTPALTTRGFKVPEMREVGADHRRGPRARGDRCGVDGPARPQQGARGPVSRCTPSSATSRASPEGTSHHARRSASGRAPGPAAR